MAPFDIVASFGKFLGYFVFLMIGLGFGAVLEMSGFGDSRKLAAQFYLKDMTVLKVMFTAIVVAMVLIFTFSSLGLLNFSMIYVNPTYLFPGIIGGLIMGVGFIVGGFCPGTSIVALATFKLDGLFFVFGAAIGVFLFGETISIFQGFHNSSYMGRFILPELFGVSTGVIVLLVVLMALLMFYGAEISEKYFGRKMAWKEIKLLPENRTKVIASSILVFLSLFALFTGQPTPEKKWEWIKVEESKKLENREVFVHPGELLGVMNDPMLYTTLLDVRSETDYNIFHLENARNVTNDDLRDSSFIKDLTKAPDNLVVMLISNNEIRSTEAYKLLRGQGVLNVYILEGGINNWLTYFPPNPEIAVKIDEKFTDGPIYVFNRAVGATIHASNPGIEHRDKHFKFEKKIKVQKKKVFSAGCS